jgi:RNA polymerase sigma-70 factor (ECF subfamily)
MDDLEAVRRGDPGARERWVSAWWPRVYRMALGMTGRETDAEDLAQETMMAGLGAVGRFRGASSESTWLYSILLRKYRSQGRRPEAVARPGPFASPPDVEEALTLLGTLRAEQKITAMLFYVEGFSIQEISRALGVVQATVRWRLFRVRQTLKTRLGKGSPRMFCRETS